MGEIADAILEGVFCQGCGDYLGEGGGYPTFCRGCQPKRPPRRRRAIHRNDAQGIAAAVRKDAERSRQEAEATCPTCGKRLRNARGRAQHQRDAHGEQVHLSGDEK